LSLAVQTMPLLRALSVKYARTLSLSAADHIDCVSAAHSQSRVGDLTLAALRDTCVHLRKLHCAQSAVSDDGFCALALRCRLVDMDVSGCAAVSHVGLAACAKELEHCAADRCPVRARCAEDTAPTARHAAGGRRSS
jgi:hypothetical protein